MADVGLVGLPNAGKSSFLRALSRARPEVGDYPFTTLTPQLGVITDGYDRYIMADLPGLIEGAREGKGLGLRFLRHVQRCRGLVYLLDGARPLADQLEVLQREVLGFDASLGQRPFLVIINKIDLDPPPFPGLRMSVKEGTGLSLVQEALWAWVRSLR
jgi:GTP-binding protein